MNENRLLKFSKWINSDKTALILFFVFFCIIMASGFFYFSNFTEYSEDEYLYLQEVIESCINPETKSINLEKAPENIEITLNVYRNSTDIKFTVSASMIGKSNIPVNLLCKYTPDFSLKSATRNYSSKSDFTSRSMLFVILCSSVIARILSFMISMPFYFYLRSSKSKNRRTSQLEMLQDYYNNAEAKKL